MSDLEGRLASLGSGLRGELNRSFFDRNLSSSLDPAVEEADLRFIHRFRPSSIPVDAVPVAPVAVGADARSALSSPDNFIAKGAFGNTFGRLVRHHRRTVGLGGGILAAALVGGIAITLGLPTLRMPMSPTSDSIGGLVVQTAEAAPALPVAVSAAPPDRNAIDLRQRIEQSVWPTNPGSSVAIKTRMAELPLMMPPVADMLEQAPPAVSQSAGSTAQVSEPVSASADPPRAEDTQKLDGLIARGQQLLDSGEVSAARLFFERAATEGDPRGALGLAKSYNERVLKSLPVIGLSGSDAEAERWYRKAAELESRHRARTTP